MVEEFDPARAVAEEYFEYARCVAWRWAGRYRWLSDEFESAALLALWTCALRWVSAAGGRKFTTYAFPRINGACADVVRWNLSPKGYRRTKERGHTAPPFEFERVSSPSVRDVLFGREMPPDWWAELREMGEPTAAPVRVYCSPLCRASASYRNRLARDTDPEANP